MKKNLLVRLYLTMMALLSLHSCRQDLLPEKETYHNTSAFRLTSKRISLDESKHKAKLLPELQKAKKEVEKQKLNIQGKLVDIGNGIIIDTDEVIYMENGPDFHTYTFSVVRENASANAPVENILMSPNTDGSYRVFHIVLNLTEADKTKIANREYINYKNKSQVTELASMNLSSLAQRSNCTPEYYQYPVPCSGPEMHLPGKPGCPLEGGERAYWATGVFWNCQNIPEPVDHIIAPSEGGPGGGSGSTDPGTPPDDCITTVTNPGEVGLINESGCNTIVPTEPNIRPTQTPCQKTKAIVAKPQIKDSLTSMKVFAQTSIRTERGFQELKSGTLVNGTVKKNLQVELGIGSNSLGTIHVHPLKGIAMFSSGDIVTFLHLLRQQDATTIGSAYAGMVSANGTYFINFTGTASDIPPAMTEIQEEVYIENLTESYIDKKNLLLKGEGKELNQQLSNTGLEKLFFDLLKKMGLDGKITLLKEENGNTSTITHNADGTTTPNPC